MQKNRLTAANLSTIGKSGQRALSHSCVGIAGLGGVGGIAFELLVRAGVGKLKIADSGFFEESNANRQSLWSKRADGVKKTSAALAFAKSLGANCKIIALPKITPENAAGFARGCAAVIDATDSRHSRAAVFSGCAASHVPYIFASARGRNGMLTVLRRRKELPEEFRANSPQASHPACDHALGPVANAIGCLAAQQAMNAALKKPLMLFPRALSIDAFSGEITTVHRF